MGSREWGVGEVKINSLASTSLPLIKVKIGMTQLHYI